MNEIKCCGIINEFEGCAFECPICETIHEIDPAIANEQYSKTKVKDISEERPQKVSGRSENPNQNWDKTVTEQN